MCVWVYAHAYKSSCVSYPPGTGGTIGCELPCGAGNPALALSKSKKCSLVLSYFWGTQNLCLFSVITWVLSDR